jgi:hypothetical protein
MPTVRNSETSAVRIDSTGVPLGGFRLPSFALALATMLSPNPSSGLPSIKIFPPVTWVRGSGPIVPGQGVEGFDASVSNFKPYRLPGQNEDPVRYDPNLPPQNIPGDPLIVSYAKPKNLPVQSSDWWTSLGLQQEGWVSGRGPQNNDVARTLNFISEPFLFQFVDFGPTLFSAIEPPHGFRLWNQNDIAVSTDGKNEFDPDKRSAQAYNPNLNFAGRGEISPAHQGVLTVGLEGVHPLKQGIPTSPPWTNVLVKDYSDWGVTAVYDDNGSELQITMANGSPLVWFEKAAGSTAPFVLWTGGSPQATGGSVTQLFSTDSMLGLSVTTTYNPFSGLHERSSTAAYVIYADQGSWGNSPAATSGTLSLYRNSQATKLAVLAVPHNVDPTDPTAVLAAARDLQPYACRKITDTQLDYPPAVPSITRDGVTLPLGYDPDDSLVRSRLRVATQTLPGFDGCTDGMALQMIFPHHRKALLASQASQVIGPGVKYTWNTLRGPAYAYAGNTMVQELRTYGVLPFLPSVAINSGLQNPLVPGQSAADDIYQTLKNWFFVQEKIAPTYDKDGNLIAANLNSFNRNQGAYVNAATNSYIPGTTALRELVFVADQLAQASSLNAVDPELGKPKQAVAQEIRDALLENLKELVGQWASVYTSQLFQYNPDFDTLYGYPAGYGAVGSLNDHHFHYGYFLRAAAAIGRFDPNWLNKYFPLINELRSDVANFDAGNPRYPFLRNFNPFFGHSWADGKAYSQNQESSSESINFAVGMIELGGILGKPNLRNWGLYLYEQEILSTQQYFFNLCADFYAKLPSTCSEDIPVPASGGPIAYSGNWPKSFVSFNGPDGQSWHTTLIGRVFPNSLDRATFFGPIDTTFAIHQIPLGASTLYLERSQDWLAATWQQYLRETRTAQASAPLSGVYEVVAAALQARLPDGGSGTDGTGLIPALTRIGTTHAFFPGSVDTQGKHWVYSHSVLGQLDTTVLADKPNYAVFNKNGTRTLVAFNPTDTAYTVTFEDAASAAKIGAVKVDPNSMATMVVGASNTLVDTLAPYDPTPDGRLYLLKNGSLSAQPGSWQPAGPALLQSFPSNLSRVTPSLTIVPPRSDGGQPDIPPDASKVAVWKGRFKGQLVNASTADCTPDPIFIQYFPDRKLGCDPSKTLQAVTRMSLYTDQCLYPGWQRCTSAESLGNTVTVRLSYFFDTTQCDPLTQSGCAADRVETYGNVALQAQDNTFVGQNKITEYYFAGANMGQPGRLSTSGFNGSFGLDLGNPQRNDVPPPPTASCTPAPCGYWIDNGIPIPPSGLFPQQVDNGAIVVELYGGSPGAGNITRPVAVSVSAAPVIGRASWVKPPYE